MPAIFTDAGSAVKIRNEVEAHTKQGRSKENYTSKRENEVRTKSEKYAPSKRGIGKHDHPLKA